MASDRLFRRKDISIVQSGSFEGPQIRSGEHNWPPKEPNMNLVENVWAELVRRIEVHWHQTEVRNHDQLWEDVLQVFHELLDEYFENFIRSMPRRVRTVSSKHGGCTKY
ncbi:transposable element Tc1 transposase [Trichonephila inaurata madagascariensis]|uniref:Transposable element Tc1 transposase n=1 Tax=Trichonephila inaurata madagascariensis TaxID=2747483 RepID=A0A8X6IGE6_9ARAC|nr:transposable element Tc1 transposase [Trichonephila inaurata madagascariensis]